MSHLQIQMEGFACPVCEHRWIGPTDHVYCVGGRHMLEVHPGTDEAEQLLSDMIDLGADANDLDASCEHDPAAYESVVSLGYLMKEEI